MRERGAVARELRGLEVVQAGGVGLPELPEGANERAAARLRAPLRETAFAGLFGMPRTPLAERCLKDGIAHRRRSRSDG